jgi:hypothetical protein
MTDYSYERVAVHRIGQAIKASAEYFNGVIRTADTQLNDWGTTHSLDGKDGGRLLRGQVGLRRQPSKKVSFSDNGSMVVDDWVHLISVARDCRVSL